MKSIRVKDAIGMVLSHDITEIRPGRFKGPSFKKGHVIQAADVEKLLDLGKRYIYVFELEAGQIHENDAAIRIAKAARGSGQTLTEPSEGKVNFKAEQMGLLKVNAPALYQINQVEDIMFASLHTNQQVEADQHIAGTRIIPLVTDAIRIQRIEDICRQFFPVVQVKPFAPYRVGLIITGSEVFEGRIQDAFGPVVEKKFQDLGSRIIGFEKVSDDVDTTVNAINAFIKQGADMVAIKGMLSILMKRATRSTSVCTARAISHSMLDVRYL